MSRRYKRKEEKECCGTCRYHFIDESNGEWYCNKRESEYYEEYTPYGYDECEEWEGRKK